MEEISWSRAPELQFFVPPEKTAPLSQTEARMLWNDKYLFVGFKARDKDILGSLTQRDSQTFKEDVLEIFFKPKEKDDRYYNFEINALGTIYDAVNAPTIRWRERKKWNSPGILININIGGTLNNKNDKDDSWHMEVAVPFKDIAAIGGTAPNPEEKWLFHLARYDYSSYLPDGKELSSCAPLTQVNFHNHKDWIILRFVK